MVKTILKPRTHIITFRVSEEEYAALKERCAAVGARSVSHLLRDAIRGLLRSPAHDDGLRARMGDLRTQIDEHIISLDRELERLTADFAQFRISSGLLRRLLRLSGTR